MLKDSALYQYLQAKSSEYSGMSIQLRTSISGWLAYIPQSFPHYTRHTVEHSDEIVRQASCLLFIEGNPEHPVVGLSGVEAYSLIAAAYLHDAGMVASDEERTSILRSAEWDEWTNGSGGGAIRYSQIVQFRESGVPADDALRNFLADTQTRFLIAEFVRQRHHLRSGRLVEQHKSELARFALDDPVLARTIGDICVSHGLSRHELHDAARYPERRTTRGELINVRFVSLVLRLCDLLDMSTDRACPLLLNAASPLPSQSLAHWTQYQRITHRLVAHDRIEIHAECQNHLEHRYLQDWCSWLVDEVDHARATMAHSQRHSEWIPPIVSIDGPNPSIRIIPSPGASYIPTVWKLDLDHDIVVERLVHDLHTDSKEFLKELIQNALDATRCRLFLELSRDTSEFSGSFTRIDMEIRDRYPLRIDLVEREFTSSLSGERETRQVLKITDCGIGMDSDVIEKYFLQIGRSFYESDEFKREFGFFASSQFGIGFLTVFAVSDNVEVDTLKAGGSEPIRLQLTGPRKYLLSERGTRSELGTYIEIMLRESFKAGELTKLVRRFCKRVEFPIHLNDLGTHSLIQAESAQQFVYSIPDVTDEEASFSVVAFSIDRPGIEGELYVFTHTTKEGESWADWSWANFTYPNLHPEASAPGFPENLVCINGISVSGMGGYSGSPMAIRLDFRHPAFRLSLTRSDLGEGYPGRRLAIPEVEGRWTELLDEHLSNKPFAKKEDSWIYKQRLVERFDLSAYWEDLPSTIEHIRSGQPVYTSLNEFLRLKEFCTVVPKLPHYALREGFIDKSHSPIALDLPHLTNVQIGLLSSNHRNTIFRNREVTDVSLQDGRMILTWAKRRSPPTITAKGANDPIEIASLPFRCTVGFPIHMTMGEVNPCVLLNIEHSTIQWLVRIKNSCLRHEFSLTEEQFFILLNLLLTPIRHSGLRLDKLLKYLDGWRDVKGLPDNLYPPEVSLDDNCFRLPKIE